MYDYLVFWRIIKIRKNDDDFSVQSIVYDYYNQIRINQKKNWWKFFVQSIVFMIILMKFSPKIENEFFYQYR